MSINKEREVPVRFIVRKKRHGHGSHGGAWKVAFADFMTAMFALFLVLWLINQSSDVKSAIAGYFSDPLGRADEFGSSILPGEGAQSSAVRPLTNPQVLDLRRNRLANFAERLEQQLDQAPELKALKPYVEIQLTDDGLRIQLLEDSTGVFFQTGKPTPSARGARILALLGQELARLRNPIRIEGHTDARPYAAGRTYGNWELSAERANTARRIMTDAGLGPEQVTDIRGLADRQPRIPDDPLADGNRRISITVFLTPGRPAPPDTATAATPVTEDAGVATAPPAADPGQAAAGAVP